MACLIRRFFSTPTASCLISGPCCRASATSLRSRPTKKWFRQYSSVRLNSRLCSVVEPHSGRGQWGSSKVMAITVVYCKTTVKRIKHIAQPRGVHSHIKSCKQHPVSSRDRSHAACCGRSAMPEMFARWMRQEMKSRLCHGGAFI